jgi:hypothetical protein
MVENTGKRLKDREQLIKKKEIVKKKATQPEG